MEKKANTFNLIRKIAVTGPESTGKSMLASQLADYYNTSWVPEYAREYLGNLNRPYHVDDILEIAKGQMKNEMTAGQNASRFLFCDTELIVPKIWSEVKYQRCDPWILEQIEKHRYDLYLLCYIDLPWMEDPLREHPHLREHLFNLYYEELLERGFPFVVIAGTGEERLNNAVNAIEQFFHH